MKNSEPTIQCDAINCAFRRKWMTPGSVEIGQIPSGEEPLQKACWTRLFRHPPPPIMQRSGVGMLIMAIFWKSSGLKKWLNWMIRVKDSLVTKVKSSWSMWNLLLAQGPKAKIHWSSLGWNVKQCKKSTDVMPISNTCIKMLKNWNCKS